ncbi:Asp23/Gls24 family envelope stress response protein [Gordonibacter sp. An230]|uniref:Asp23/Gls24 family envelope stress response protein n=1 Tax=Gordonibacter sp. An230 TaxID=1965592 RepID=UPI000B39279A|nr:Asp23/Gls24 family envelope stress response protein [Gordonibacter sp. An230]OUO92538.1 Asp23/Gls24 family envelope stress response protein [Gordonibacter sp. An230]
MAQSTLNPSSTKSTYDPYSSVDEKSKGKGDSFDLRDLEDVSAEPVYKLVINENVVEKISSLAAQKIDGIIDMKGNVLSRIQEGLGGADKTKGVDADIIDDAGAKLDLDVILEYGKSAPQVFDEIKKVVGEDLKDMTGLEVIEMTVNVVDVMTQDEYDQKNGNNNGDGQQDGSSN